MGTGSEHHQLVSQFLRMLPVVRSQKVTRKVCPPCPQGRPRGLGNVSLLERGLGEGEKGRGVRGDEKKDRTSKVPKGGSSHSNHYSEVPTSVGEEEDEHSCPAVERELIPYWKGGRSRGF